MSTTCRFIQQRSRCISFSLRSASSKRSSWVSIAIHFDLLASVLSSMQLLMSSGLYFSPACRFYQRQHAIDAVCFCNGATLDDMEIRCELDPGFEKGREFGYGLSGGQSIDDLRLKPHSERPREQFVPWRNRAECVLQHVGKCLRCLT